MHKLLLGAAIALAVSAAQATPGNGRNKSLAEDAPGASVRAPAGANGTVRSVATNSERGGNGAPSPSSDGGQSRNGPAGASVAKKPENSGKDTAEQRQNTSVVPAAAAEAGPGITPPAARQPRPGHDEQRLRQARRIATEPASIDVNGNRYFSLQGTRLGYDPGVSRASPLIDGCPPRLESQQNGCLPPSLVRSGPWTSLRPEWWGLTGMDGRYVYHGGYLLRLTGDKVSGYVPLLGGALSVGNGWPSSYAPMEMPAYYVDLYALGTSSDYRYANNVIYRIEPRSGAITSIAAMLTGDRFTIGEKAPPGYDLYNIPVGYRDHYIDRANAIYRYSDGYIYEIDPTTRLVRAAIELMVN